MTTKRIKPKLCIKDKTKHEGGIHSAVASHLEKNTQFQKYHNVKAGHGFAAEDSNALDDVLSGKNVEKIGTNNARDGADRLVDKQLIQVKYYKNPEDTIQSLFNKEGYRYRGQFIEVPKDQYEKCVKLMRKEIENGNVFDAENNLITDTKKAEELVKKGNITYEQAKNISKAGNIDSLKFDAKNNAISSLSCFGISFIIGFARYSWDETDFEDAVKAAFSDALAVGGVAFITGIVSSQLLRTKTAAAGTLLVRPGLKAIYGKIPFNIGKNSIETIASASLGKTVAGGAAINHVSKLLRTNIITAGITTVITMTPDFYRAMFDKNLSWGQFTKNLLVQVGSVAGGTAGWMGGAATGASLGSAVPVIGTAVGAVIGGISGALAGGIGGASITKGFLNSIVKDDAEEMLDIVRTITEDFAYDYLISENEYSKIMSELQSLLTQEWLRKMFAIFKEEKNILGMEGREHIDFATKEIRLIFEKIVKQRIKVSIDDEKIEQYVLDYLDEEAKDDEIEVNKNIATHEEIVNIPKEKEDEEVIYEIIFKHLKPVVEKDKNSLYLKGYSENFPSKKLENGIDAINVFGDEVFAYYDATLFGKGDLGFILSDYYIYFKEAFSDSAMIHYSSIENVTNQRSAFKVYDDEFNPSITCTNKYILEAVIAALKEIRIYFRNN